MTSLHFAQLCHLLAAGSIPSDDDKEAKSQRPTALSEAGVHYVIDVLKNVSISVRFSHLYGTSVEVVVCSATKRGPKSESPA